MSVEPDKSAGCPTESDGSSIERGDCVKRDNIDVDEKKKVPRSVHFPGEGEVVTQYFEPANPWHNVPMTTRAQLAAEYLESCRRHNTHCIDSVLQQIRELPEASIGGVIRAPRLTLSECALIGPAPADALEAVLRKVQFRRIEVDHAEIDDEGAEALFDMVEYYESATVVCISGPRQFGIRGWQAASRMIKKSAELSELEVTDSALEASHSPVLARSLRPVTCRLRALCLQRVALCGEPLLCLVIALKSNNSIRELRLGDNRLSIPDAAQLATLLKYNNRIQLLDLSNNQIQDAGVGQLADALAEQAAQSPPSAAASPLSPHRCQVGGHEARGLAFLVLWNNQLTRNCAPHLSKALRSCASLCVLNVGRNALGSDVPRAACAGSALVSLGLQAARLGPDAAQSLAELIRHHPRLQRLDLRENRLGSLGLQAILSVMKDNTTLTQIDLDEPPESTNLLAEDSESSLVRRLTREIRTLCLRNEPLGRPDDQDPVHRKISLTCHTVCLLRQGMGGEEERRGRLRSPAPSPAPSPAGSPVPTPHTNSRFSVTRVTPERDPDATRPSTPTRPTYCHTPSRFRVVQVMEPPKIQVHPATTPRKSASRFSVTRNYDSMYNPSPSPPASPAYPPIDSVTSATTPVTQTIPTIVTAPVTINPSFNPGVVRTVIEVPAIVEETSREVKGDIKEDGRSKSDSEVEVTSKLVEDDSVKRRVSAENESPSLQIDEKASNLQSEVSNRTVQPEVCSKTCSYEGSRSDLREIDSKSSLHCEVVRSKQAEVVSKSNLRTEVSNRSNMERNVEAEVGSITNLHPEVSNRPNVQTNVQAEVGSKSHTEMCKRPNVQTNAQAEVGSKSNLQTEVSNRPMQTIIQAEVDSKSNLNTEVSTKPNLQTDVSDKLSSHCEASKTDKRTEVVSKTCLKCEVSYRSDSKTDIDSKACSHSELIKPNVQAEVSSKSNLHTEVSNKLNLQPEVDNKTSLQGKVENISVLQTDVVDKTIVKSDVKTDAVNKTSLQTDVENKPASTSNDEKDLQDNSGLQTDIDKKPISQACNQPPLQSKDIEKDIVKLKESATLVKNTSEKIEKLKDSCKKAVLKETVEKCDIHITKDVSIPLRYDTQIRMPEGIIQVIKDNVSETENVPTTDVLNDPTLNKNVAGILKSDTTHKTDNKTLKNESKTTNLEATSSRTHTTIVELSELKIETTIIDSTISRQDIDKEILKTDSISKVVGDCDVCDSSKDKILEKHQPSVNNPDTECKQPNKDVVSEKKDLSDKDKVIDNVKTVTSDLKYSDVVKNTIKHEQNTTIKQIVAITEDLGNIIKEMRTLVKDNVETPVKDIILKKNKSESSLDSPDLEVSRLTEKMSSVFDSNSSLEISGSSMESLNEHNKTVQELDRRKSGVILSGSSLESDVTPINTNLLNLSVSSNDSVSPIFGKTRVIHDSLSSLEASVSSLDSGKQEKLMVTSADSGIEYSLQNPSENKEDNSSNEGTLTNNSSLKDTVKKTEIADSSTDSPKRASSLLDVPALKNKGLDRMRKISWVAPSPSFQVPKPDEKETKPSHLEKLLSLFQHPSSIFSRSSGSEDEKKSASNTPPRKDSTLASSFWSWGSTIDKDKEEDSSEATDSTLSERVQVFFVDESFSRKLDSKTPSTDTDNTLSEFQSFPQESESDRDRVTVTTEDNIVQKVDLSVNSQDIDIAKTGAIDLLKEKESVNIEKDDIARPRSFAAVLKASGSENSLDKQNSPDNGQSVDKLPSKVIRGIKENISPENTLTSSMTNTKTLAEELERQVKTPPLLEVSLKNEPKLEEIKAPSDLAPIATIEEIEDIFTKIDDVKVDKDSSVDSGVVESDKKDKEIDLGKDALSYLMYENRDFDIGSENLIKTTAQQGSLAQELKEAEIKEILDLSPELVVDEGLEDPVFSAKEIIGLRSSPIVPERAKLKKSNSLEDLSHVETEKTSPKTKTIVFKVPESTTPRDIPERRSKLRTRSGSSPKSLPESLNKPCPLTKMESILTKKKKKVSSLGKIARDSLLALNMSEEEIAEFRRSYKLTSVESLKSLESVSEDANSQSGNSVDSRCRACLRTSQESLMSLDSITEDCRCTDDCEKPGRSAR